jgi:hypothetical protein
MESDNGGPEDANEKPDRIDEASEVGGREWQSSGNEWEGICDEGAVGLVPLQLHASL